MVGEDGQTERDKIFQEMLRNHRGQISALVRRVVRPHEVKDVEQEVFLALWGSTPNAPQDPPARFSWIRELVRRVSLGWVRKEIKDQGGRPDPVGCGAVRPVLLGMDESGVEAEAVLARSSEHLDLESTLISEQQERWRRATLRRALNELTPELKAAYVAVKLDGLGSVEAALKLGIGRNTLLTRIRDAADRINKCLNVATVDAAVCDSAGKRVSARVRLDTLTGAKSICEAHTNKRDPVRFEGLQPGEYVITAEADGHSAAQKIISVRAGLIEVQINLQPDTAKTASE